MADGSITYSTKLDNKDLEKDLAKANKRVEQLEGQLQKNTDKRLPISKQVSELGGQLDAAKAKLAALQDESQHVSAAITGANTNDPASVAAYTEAAARQAGVTKELATQQKLVDSLQGKFDRAADRLDAVDAASKRISADLSSAKDKAGALASELYKPASAADAVAGAVDNANRQLRKFSNRVMGLARRVFIFTVITAALRSVKDWMGKVAAANSETSAAVARLKGALLTLAQPITAVLIPAFTALVNILTRIVSAIAGFVSLLFGKTIGQSKDAAKELYDEAAAIEATGSAAKGASKSLASFDEINKLSNGASGGGGASTAVVPDFSFDTSGMEKDFDKLLNWVKLIGAALLAWKLADSFLDGLRIFAGLLLAINGAIALAKGAWDAWQNGLDMDNLLQMLGGAMLLATGLGIAFGTVGAGIGLIVGGLTLLATGLHDAMEVGWNFENMLATVAGIIMTGLGISVLTGSWIPLLVAAIAGLLLVFTNAFGQGQTMLNGIKLLLQGFLDFFKGIFSMDLTLTLQGIQTMVLGLQTIIQAVLQALKTAVDEFFTWLDEATGGRLSGLFDWIRTFLNSFIDTISKTLTDFVSSIGQILSGIVTFISGVFSNNWKRAWDGIATILKGIWNLIVSTVENAINLVIDIINAMVRAFNRAFSVMRALTGFPPIIDEMPHVELPKLAKGAVIPPNREFLAVLGDQKSGTNIEAPLSTIENAVGNVLNRRGAGTGGGEQTIILECDKVQFAKLVYKLNQSESKRHGVSLVGV